MAEDEIVDLNVGGILYTTTLSTLTRYPDSMLGAMFGGHFETRKDRSGNVFIDRDGKLFRIILNYLRSSKLNLPDNFTEIAQFQDEIDFYQIQPLIEEFEKTKVKPPSSKNPWNGRSILVEILTRTGAGLATDRVELKMPLFDPESIDMVLLYKHQRFQQFCSIARDGQDRFRKGAELIKLGGKFVGVTSWAEGGLSWILEKWEIEL